MMTGRGRTTRPARVRALLLLLAVLPIPAACPGASASDDAGGHDDVDAGLPPPPAGFTRCGPDGVLCQPGTRCDDETGTCRPGCAVSAQCLPSERCDGSVCRPTTTRLCTDDDDGTVACGPETCAAASWCRDPAAGVCLDGCRSSENCRCGQVCTTTVSAGSGACTDVAGAPVCGDEVCAPGETEVSCPDDCTDWTLQCEAGCARFSVAECADFDAPACLDACATADEGAQRDFVACVANAQSTLCLGYCLDHL